MVKHSWWILSLAYSETNSLNFYSIGIIKYLRCDCFIILHKREDDLLCSSGVYLMSDLLVDWVLNVIYDITIEVELK